MSGLAVAQSNGPSTAELRIALSRFLAQHRRGVRIQRIERAPCIYGSSWCLEDIAVQLDNGSTMALVLKDFGREAEGSGARRVKPAFVTDAGRELWMYRTVLRQTSGPAGLVAAGRHWLLLERMAGTPLTQVGDRAAWSAAARWLGGFHATVSAPAEGSLIRHDAAWHRGWLKRALAVAQHDASRSAAQDVAHQKLARLRALVPVHEAALQLALSTPPSLIHGEFYPSNVLVESAPDYAVHPVDWEMAAVGPPLFDLAALVSGWDDDGRAAMVRAYRDGAGWTVSVDELLRGVAACRLLLAVQWLGWAADWTAPADHRNDWLEEAERCAEEVRR